MIAALLLVSTPALPSWDAAVQKGFKGGAVVVADGKVLFQGVSEKGVNPRTPFPICSVTKLMTATMVMQCIAAGQLKEEATAGSVLPWLPELAKGVTVRQLLLNTSGLPNFDQTQPPLYSTKDAKYRPLKARILHGLTAPPGKPGEYAYNNLDFLILEAMLEANSGRSYADLLERRILRPAGMSRTRLASYGPLPGSIPPSRDEKGNPVRGYNYGAFGGAGALISTLEDMGKFLAWMLAQPRQESPVRAGSQLNGFAGFGGYAYEGTPFGAPTLLYERPGAIEFYRWQATFLPSKNLAAIAFSLEGGKLGSGFEGGGLVVDLLKDAMRRPDQALN